MKQTAKWWRAMAFALVSALVSSWAILVAARDLHVVGVVFGALLLAITGACVVILLAIRR